MVSSSMKAKPASKIRPMSAPVASSLLGDATSSIVLDIVCSSSLARASPRASRSDRQGVARLDAGSGPKTRGQHPQSSFGVRCLKLEERPVVPRGAGAEQSERSLELRRRFLLPFPLKEVALLGGVDVPHHEQGHGHHLPSSGRRQIGHGDAREPREGTRESVALYSFQSTWISGW